MSYLKIHQGTGRLTGESLCNSCSHAMIVTDARGQTVRCIRNSFLSFSPRGKVTDCTTYYNANLPSLAALGEIAWELKTEGSGSKMGFKPPTQKDRPPS